MLQQPYDLIADFLKIASISGFNLEHDCIQHECLKAPHSGVRLLSGYSGIYVFSLSVQQQVVLKVGKAGPKTKARFESQHYNPNSSPSNLAKSLLKSPANWIDLGISVLDEKIVGSWIKSNTDRDHFFLQYDSPLLDLFEVFLHCRLKPLYEG